MEEQNELISQDINMFAFESNKDTIESKKQNYKLQNLLEKIEQESGVKTWTQDELEFYSVEFWKTAKEYENELRAEKKGTDYEKDLIKNKAMKKIDDVKTRASFQIEALELAMTELKVKKSKEINHLMMKLSEYESIAFNSEVRNDEIDSFMLNAKGGISSMQEAQDRLFQAVKYMKKLKDTIELLKKDFRLENQLRMSIEKTRDEALKATQNYQEFFDELFPIIMFNFKKLELAKPAEIESIY